MYPIYHLKTTECFHQEQECNVGNFSMAVPMSVRLWISPKNRNVVASLKGKDGLSQPWGAHVALCERHQACMEVSTHSWTAVCPSFSDLS